MSYLVIYLVIGLLFYSWSIIDVMVYSGRIPQPTFAGSLICILLWPIILVIACISKIFDMDIDKLFK